MVTFWFIAITVLWTGFFILEGFDFGVGMLHDAVGADEPGRRAAINTIGPLWDGNEVWLVVAGAATFAAFPGWYATWFSGFYLALVLLLAALIVRGLAFEYRGKRGTPRWRRTWDAGLTVGSLLAPLLIGVALGDLLHGLPVNSSHEYTGSFWTLLQPYGVFTGITFVGMCLLHGATFLCLKTTGDMHERARRLARRIAPVTGLLVLAFVSWTHAIAGKGALLNPIEFAAVLTAIAAFWLVCTRSEGWAFAATTVTIATCILAIFTDLYPRVMVSSTNPAFSLTVQNSASGRYALTVMTVVVVVFLPFVLAYQTWTYYVFRRRVSRHEFRPQSGQEAAPAGYLDKAGRAVPHQPGASDPSEPGATRSRWG